MEAIRGDAGGMIGLAASHVNDTNGRGRLVAGFIFVEFVRFVVVRLAPRPLSNPRKEAGDRRNSARLKPMLTADFITKTRKGENTK